MTISAMQTSTHKNPKSFQWADIGEDDNGEDLPPSLTIGPDENGIKKIVEFKVNDKGQMVRVTTTTKLQKVAKARISKHAVERRSWSKFGDAAHEDVGSRLTVVSNEEIWIERPGMQVDDTIKAKETLIDPGKGTLMTCRVCGKKGEHWTAQCPQRHLSQHPDTLVPNPPPSTGENKGTYVPPSFRGDKPGHSMKNRNDENSVRVTNLSEDTREDDLRELFGRFGHLSRVYVALDRATGESRGFGFVNFTHRDDAQRAINTLNGYGYDSLILGVDWATPRPDR
ncbi:hypothetical protein ACHQM5_020150 [Ranunculus cassubicifolius]